MDELVEGSGIDLLVQIRIRRSISVLGEGEGHMMMIDQDRVKKVKDVELMEKTFNIAKEIREEIRKK